MRQPVADDVAMDLFASTGGPSVFLKIVHSKVRFRTWLRRHPTQQQRKAWDRALFLHGVVPPGVDVGGGQPRGGAARRRGIRAAPAAAGWARRTYSVLHRS